MIKPKVQRIFMQNGFTIKEGQTDLKPYVYEAAQALLNEANLTINEIKTVLNEYGVDNDHLVYALWLVGHEKVRITECTLNDFWAAVEKSGMTLMQLRDGLLALEAKDGTSKA